MAIRRCPYCKAIIDEKDKYCNNCGTQLLFPEDEYVEEDIPGDKITDEDEELEEEEENDEEEEENNAGDEEDEEDEELEEEETEEELEEEEEEDLEVTAEDELGDKKVEKEESEEEWELAGGEKEGEEIEESPEEEVIEEPVLEETEEEEVIEEEAEGEEQEEEEKKYEISLEGEELVFKTKELERLTRSVDEEEKETREGKTTDTKDELPPWASGMKGGGPSDFLPLEEEEREGDSGTEEVSKREEGAPVEKEWTADSGIGIPEKVTKTQPVLPFTDRAKVEEIEPSEEGEEDEGEAFAAHAPGFSMKLKGKLFDIIFITALWLISLLFTSQVIGVSFFRLFSVSGLLILAFYLVLLVLYFFLFLFFLGETLGDHYFSEGD